MGASLVQMRQVLGPYEQVVAAFSRLGLPSRRIGTAPYGLDIYAYRVGEAGPTGMVTAGAHAEEVAGVATAYSLAARFQPGLQGWIVPCRDPLGWDGFRRNLARAVGRPVRIRSHHDVVELIKREGEPILLGDVTVGIIDQVAFSRLPTPIRATMTPEFSLTRFLASGTTCGSVFWASAYLCPARRN